MAESLAPTPDPNEGSATPAGTPPNAPATPPVPEAAAVAATAETPTTTLRSRRPRSLALPVAPPPSKRAIFVRKAVDLLAPYALLAVVAAPFALYYRLELVGGTHKLQWGRPAWLGLLAALPLVAAYAFHRKRGRAPTMIFSRTADLRETAQGAARHLVHLPKVLRLVALGLLAVAMARPQYEGAEITEVEGIDIVIALDVSNSMSEKDIRPDRLSAAKEVLQRFIEKRKSDRIGLVIFGREAFTQCPLTLDYRALAGLLTDVRLGLIDGQGTAIGNALATALNRLRHSDAKSKVIILLTDGDNNSGNISPQQSSKYAQSLGVKVFTVLMGSDVADVGQPGVMAHPRYPVNPKLLEEIAGTTGGTPYLATDADALEKRFQAILDELDRSRIKDQKTRPSELYKRFVYPALLLLILELALSLTRYRRFP